MPLKEVYFSCPNSATKRCFVAFDPQGARNGVRGRYRVRWKGKCPYFEARRKYFELHTSGTICDDIRHSEKDLLMANHLACFCYAGRVVFREDDRMWNVARKFGFVDYWLETETRPDMCYLEAFLELCAEKIR